MLLAKLGFDVRGALRVLSLLAFISVSIAVWTVRRAYANAEQRIETVGQQVLRQLTPLLGDEPTSIRINGSQMYISASTTKESPQAAIDRLQRYCAQNAPSLQPTLRGMKVPAAESRELGDPSSWLTARSSKTYAEVAHLACIARPNAGSLADLATRLAAFAIDGDLSHIGSMVYAIATREADGHSRVVAIWSSGQFELATMFPRDGDAPGSDSLAIARPPQSIRLLSASLEGHSFGVRMYDSQQTPAAVLAYYDRHHGGSSVLALPLFPDDSRDAKLTSTPSYARAYETGSGLLLITATEDPMGGPNSQVTVLELGRPDDTERR